MRTIGRIIGILFLVGIAAALLSSSTDMMKGDKDADGFLLSGVNRLETSSFAMTREPGTLNISPSWLVGWFTDVVDVRVTATSSSGDDIFMGVADADDVRAYLANVAYDEITEIDLDPVDADYRPHEGAADPATPGAQTFWIVSTEGPGSRTLDWDLEPGDWAGVLMNADAGRGVSVDIVAGWRLAHAAAWIWGCFWVGIVLILAALWWIFRWIRRVTRRQALSTPPTGPAPTG